MSTPLTPLDDRVIAVKEKTANTTASGFFLPDSAKEKSSVAVVEAVGPKAKSIKKGDRIVYKEYSATELKVNGVEYLIVKEEDILATLTNKGK